MISFKSKIAKQVLGYFFLNPNAEMYLNEMARKFKVDRGNLVRKLSDWEKEGLLIKDKKGNLSVYQVNKRYPFLPELKKIFKKSFGIEIILREKLKGIKGLKMAVIFGSYAKDKLSAESDIDLLLIGSHDSLEAIKKILDMEEQFGREINIVDMTEKEFEKKKNEDFLKGVLSDKYIRLL